MHNPSHPGELLRTWIEGANVTVTQLADHIGVTRATLSRIINGHAGVTRRWTCGCIKRLVRARACGLIYRSSGICGLPSKRKPRASRGWCLQSLTRLRNMAACRLRIK